MFTSLSNTFRHLTKHIAAQLPSLLHSSIGLRYSPAQHVRKLAADSFGYLFRHSSQSGLKLGVKAVLAEAALQPCPGMPHNICPVLVTVPSVTCCGCRFHTLAPAWFMQ